MEFRIAFSPARSIGILKRPTTRYDPSHGAIRSRHEIAREHNSFRNLVTPYKSFAATRRERHRLEGRYRIKRARPVVEVHIATMQAE
jgi:hypothetical protein